MKNNETEIGNTAITVRLLNFFEEAKIEYRYIEHEPTYTSEESAKARSEELKIGGKALLLKADESFVLIVIPADRKLNSKAVKTFLGIKKIRFATKGELLEQTGLVPGAVPPFGPPIFNHSLYVDESVFENEKIAFNAGLLTASVVMSIDFYRKIFRGRTGSFVNAKT